MYIVKKKGKNSSSGKPLQTALCVLSTHFCEVDYMLLTHRELQGISQEAVRKKLRAPGLVQGGLQEALRKQGFALHSVLSGSGVIL